MRNLKTIILIACAVFTLSSCETEDIQEPVSVAKVKTTLNKDGGGTTGGEEEEIIIIYGLTQNVSNDPIVNAEVILYDAATNALMSIAYTNQEGDFDFSELAGKYYFIVNAPGYLAFQSLDLDFPLNNGIILTLQED